MRNRQLGTPTAWAQRSSAARMGAVGLKEIAGGRELGKIQRGGGGELGQGQARALVPGHVHPQGMGGGKGPQGVAERGLGHGRTSFVV